LCLSLVPKDAHAEPSRVLVVPVLSFIGTGYVTPAPGHPITPRGSAASARTHLTGGD
jgi:hypothetical protein